ncbi:MAG: hypothetical protein GXP03_04950 [Alphaproteobacteria bacterium]|nr:hypothetical protein [Alphaproteobacteria bacterium]
MRYSFANCILNSDNHQLTRDGHEIPIEPQVFDLLHLLVTNAGQLITKDLMMETVWQGRIVSEATVSARINAARKAVGDNGKDQAIIKTVSRRGLKLVVSVDADGKSPEPNVQKPARQTIKYTTSKDGTAIAYATSGSGPPLLRAGHNLTHLELDWASNIWPPLCLTRWAKTTRLSGLTFAGRDFRTQTLKAKTFNTMWMTLPRLRMPAGWTDFQS